MGAGCSAVVYTTAPTAPAAAALFNLVSKKQVPRKIRAICPVSEPAGRAEQANPLLSRLETSFNGAVTGPGGGGADPGTASSEVLPTATLAENTRSLLLAPTAMTDGPSPGELMVA